MPGDSDIGDVRVRAMVRGFTVDDQFIEKQKQQQNQQ